jgi:hypothetical protein
MGERGDYGSPSLPFIFGANDLATTIKEVLAYVLAIKYHFKSNCTIPRSYVEVENPAHSSAPSVNQEPLAGLYEQKPIVRLFLYAVYICFPSRLSADGE